MNVVLGSEFNMAHPEAVDGRFEVARFTVGFEFPLFAKTSRSGRLAR